MLHHRHLAARASVVRQACHLISFDAQHRPMQDSFLSFIAGRMPTLQNIQRVHACTCPHTHRLTHTAHNQKSRLTKAASAPKSKTCTCNDREQTGYFYPAHARSARTGREQLTSLCGTAAAATSDAASTTATRSRMWRQREAQRPHLMPTIRSHPFAEEIEELTTPRLETP